jgi:hypothetical protein
MIFKKMEVKSLAFIFQQEIPKNKYKNTVYD